MPCVGRTLMLAQRVMVTADPVGGMMIRLQAPTVQRRLKCS